MNQSDSVDRLLAEFFHAEVPAVWPKAPRVTDPVTVALRRRDPLSRSRWALAASVAAVLLGGWLLAHRVATPDIRPASFDNMTATRPAELHFSK